MSNDIRSDQQLNIRPEGVEQANIDTGLHPFGAYEFSRPGASTSFINVLSPWEFQVGTRSVQPTGRGYAYRTDSFSIDADTTHFDIDLNETNGCLSGVAHSTGTLPDQMSVTVSGVYSVSYRTSHYRATAFYAAVRVRINDSLTVPGSDVLERVEADEYKKLGGDVMVSLSSGDFLTLQAWADVDTSELETQDDTRGIEPTAYMKIERIG